MDVGSTTTDIIPIIDGRVAVRGQTDTDRLRSGELVYTGSLRTPVCALVRGRPCAVVVAGSRRSTLRSPPTCIDGWIG